MVYRIRTNAKTTACILLYMDYTIKLEPVWHRESTSQLFGKGVFLRMERHFSIVYQMRREKTRKQKRRILGSVLKGKEGERKSYWTLLPQPELKREKLIERKIIWMFFLKIMFIIMKQNRIGLKL